MATAAELQEIKDYERRNDDGGEARGEPGVQEIHSVAPQTRPFWILDFGFWIAGGCKRVREIEQSKIQNPKSKIREFIAAAPVAASTTSPACRTVRACS